MSAFIHHVPSGASGIFKQSSSIQKFARFVLDDCKAMHASDIAFVRTCFHHGAHCQSRSIAILALPSYYATRSSAALGLALLRVKLYRPLQPHDNRQRRLMDIDWTSYCRSEDEAMIRSWAYGRKYAPVANFISIGSCTCSLSFDGVGFHDWLCRGTYRPAA